MQFSSNNEVQTRKRGALFKKGTNSLRTSVAFGNRLENRDTQLEPRALHKLEQRFPVPKDAGV